MSQAGTGLTAGPPVGFVGAKQEGRAGGWPRLSRAGNGVGVIAVLVAWELLALFVFAGKHVMPTPFGLAGGLWDNRALLWANAGTTLSEAGQGWLWGNALAIGAALLFVVSPPVEAALLRLAIASYCMPIIAIAPILNIVFNGEQPKVVLAAVSVFFTTLIGVTAGLRSADQLTLDVVHAYGGTKWTALSKIRLRAALPSLFAALCIAVPAALLGAIIGEYLGGNDGIGVAMINAEQSLEVTRVWSLALFAAALAGAGYAVTAAVARLATPWARGAAAGPGPARPPARSSSTMAGRVARSAGFLALSVAAALVCWVGFIKVFNLNSYFAKTPADVWDYLFQGSSAAADRQQLWAALLTTLRDASLGYAAGTLLAVVAAMAVVSNRTVEAAFMPVAVVLRSVPLVAMTPLIALAFGRGLLSVTVIAGIVTFFPTLVYVVSGLRSPPLESVLLMRAYDASNRATLFKLRLPSALPSLFSSAKIAAPGAMLGAVLAEWLSTGQGLGYLMLEASTTSAFAQLWSGVVLITVVSAVIYAFVGLVEGPVLRRFGPAG
ncbi:MAG TPA: ABC transporter permease subunit [Acidimicrobiales bacterium]|nr:ABC transporter permease subunit [Acidimicrobiales bacterium]